MSIGSKRIFEYFFEMIRKYSNLRLDSIREPVPIEGKKLPLVNAANISAQSRRAGESCLGRQQIL